MRITRLVAATGIVSALVLAGGITAGLILARDQAPPAAPTVPNAAAPAVEKNAANTAGNGVLVNRTSGGAIRKQAQHGQDAGPVSQPGPGGGPVSLPGASADEDKDEDRNKEMNQGQDQALALPEKTELKYPNLGSHLDGLVVQVEEEETTSEDAASDTPVHSGESVAVTIHLSGSVDEVVKFLEDKGGDPRNVGEDYIEAYVPVTLLGQLSEQSGVIRVREIIPPEPGQGG